MNWPETALVTRKKRGIIKRAKRKPVSKPTGPEYRINNQIRVREVRLIDHTGTNHGVVAVEAARDIARSANLDLVEVAPNADP
ncbi:MAG: hypothetical protein KDE56_30545, partial [Anaerolineales bacterium]|nr:hypothetical protein [Anaerolineales bacterium]